VRNDDEMPDVVGDRLMKFIKKIIPFCRNARLCMDSEVNKEIDGEMPVGCSSESIVV